MGECLREPFLELRLHGGKNVRESGRDIAGDSLDVVAVPQKHFGKSRAFAFAGGEEGIQRAVQRVENVF